MGKDDDLYADVPPDDIKRAPSGRIPQWVLDEARGITTEPVPFRASTTPLVGPKARKGHRKEWLILVVVAGVVITASYVLKPASPTAPAPSSHPAVVLGARLAPPPGNEESPSRLLPEPSAGTSSSYRFLQRQEDRVTPVTWSPCRPVHYVVRPDYSPVHGTALLEDAFTQLSRATGLRFINDGTTKEAPAEDRPRYQPKLYGDRWAPVLVVWATPDEVPDFGVDVAGEALSAPVYTPDRSLTYASGTVALDARKFAGYVQSARGLAFARSVILHELGHLAGLAHVNDPRQVMSPRGTAAAYQPGDLAGLAILGKGPCQPAV